MLLPFIWPENYLDITKAGWADEMGEVDIHDFDALRHANGGTDPITVTVFCWAENLTLAVPTTSVAQSDIAPSPNSNYSRQGRVEDKDLDEFGFPKPYTAQASKQSKKAMMKGSNVSSGDEFVKDGLISKPASAMAKVADALSMIPVVAPYAKATSLVSTRIGDIAKIFGYSRPQVLDDIRPFVPRFGNMANSDAPEALVKLSLDSKNELSIDTRLMGLGGEDELTVNSIAQRWSYFRQFDWPESATTDSMLTSIKVWPNYGQTLTASPVKELHPTALCFASSPFEAWQGSIKFRFNVVCSEYHRGRIRIVYNPTTSPSGAIPFNQTYSTVVDISENRDFEYEVKWADIRAWGLNAGVGSLDTDPGYDDVNPVTCGGLYDNGSISVYVVNELATPSTTAADVKIQVWVAAGDDYAVAVPTTKNLAILSYHAQQSEIAPNEALASAEDTSNSPGCVTEVKAFAAGEGIKESDQYLVYQGERIVSLRELLRRYNYHNCYFPGGDGTTGQTRVLGYNIHNFPFYRGWETNGQDTATNSVSATAGYNFCSMTMMNYLTPAFACRRGGIRHKTVISNLEVPSTANPLTVSRHNILGKANGVDDHVQTGNAGDRRSKRLDLMGTGLGGTHLTPYHVNPVLEYETPFYTAGQRFLPGRKINLYDQVEMAHEVALDVQGGTSANAIRIDKYVSAAEDFQLGMFVGAPVIYQYGDPTAVS
ncbi:hypothetical protein 2 [Beihai picorna-like virus 1]|uniref:hypothetical protein 2 n=1 Tax=Beihai picorna-like virus 1 TaxID=1922527 RepID=UPI00090BC03A|nr:hypothetical protein 2 [Beihai picorna-like virus 1]APG76729.1 hypothetical protein 2 [Beihai picorna-like virus 1]APG76800.1 hypothetical protein 2 [Beihai picorna-like virus 1]APG76836.1 hypothetical protein 2 [Beihai picorna-like virus 1]APG76893.1 hypothetical protein 2 [Beihai picorna-like virus 1]APG78023.1 hypothetical protein 2 [Beihai picorna-like virus 1]